MHGISAGDTAWVLASAALVMLMTPAVGFFYGGLVRRKNALATADWRWASAALPQKQNKKKRAVRRASRSSCAHGRSG